jgi:hypothetical protein
MEQEMVKEGWQVYEAPMEHQLSRTPLADSVAAGTSRRWRRVDTRWSDRWWYSRCRRCNWVNGCKDWRCRPRSCRSVIIRCIIITTIQERRKAKRYTCRDHRLKGNYGAPTLGG